MGDIITFYSYKGGVGRTMALANAAVLLARWGYKILIVDWDLEAPGLEFYFQEYFSLEKAAQQQGIIDILESISKNPDDFVESTRWQENLITIKLPRSREPIHLLTSGQKGADYFSKVRDLDLNSLYTEKRGGFLIESLRNEWKEVFDFTLIDSRTGVTDIGGVCTIQLPDVLVLLFTANEQSLEGVINIARKALQARQKLPVSRFHLLSVPIPAKFDSREEYQAAQWWLDHFSERLRDLYLDWLPTDVNRRKFLEVTKLPYISYFSFGEKLPVIEQETNDPTGLGYAYENLAAMIANNWEPMEELLENRSYFIRSAQKVRANTVPTLAESLDETPVVQTLSKDEIVFPNKNRAQVVKVPIGTNPNDILRALDMQSPQVVITLAGGADLLNDRERSYLIQSFSNGLVQAASEIGAIIIDGGTASGMIEIIGQAVAKQRRKIPLLGIALAGKVTYPGRSSKPSAEDSMSLDSNHTHFVLVESDTWGSETDTMHQVEEVLGEKIPVVTVLIRGGTIAKEEVLHSVQNGWPILVVQGSGGLADELASLWQKKESTRSQRERANRTRPASQSDHALTELIDEGNFHLLPLETSVDQVRKQLKQLLLYQRERVLALAWERFALYDNNAKLQQVRFRRLQVSSLVLGIAATAVALVQAFFREVQIILGGSFLDQVIHAGVIVTAMAWALLIVVFFLLKRNSWIILRGSAEAIMQEIYRYRTQTGDYANKAPPQFSSHTKPKRLPQEILVEKIERISNQLMRTEINISSLRPYTGPIPPIMYGAAGTDDGYSMLTPEQYISIRVEDQLAYYQAKTHQLARDLVTNRWLILFLAGLGVLLASLGIELWVPLTVVIVTSLTAYLESRQSASKLLIYNKIVANLNMIKHWWIALTEDERVSEENFVKLVNSTEETLMQADTDKIQQFEDPVSKLREFSQKSNSPDEHIVTYK